MEVISKVQKNKYEIFGIKQLKKGDIYIYSKIKGFDIHTSVHKDGKLWMTGEKINDKIIKHKLFCRKIQSPLNFKGICQIFHYVFKPYNIKLISKKYKVKKTNNLFKIDLSKFKGTVNISAWLFDESNLKNYMSKIDNFENPQFHIFELSNCIIGVCAFDVCNNKNKDK